MRLALERSVQYPWLCGQYCNGDGRGSKLLFAHHQGGKLRIHGDKVYVYLTLVADGGIEGHLLGIQLDAITVLLSDERGVHDHFQ